jgi:hypothetical protein
MTTAPYQPGVYSFHATNSSDFADAIFLLAPQIKPLVKAVLKSPQALDWTVHGIGLMLTYLDKEHRLHVFDQSLRVETVSPIHDHAWHLKSYIVAGILRQRRYDIVAEAEGGAGWVSYRATGGRQIEKFKQASINTVGIPIPTPGPDVFVESGELEEYREGQSYHQHNDEIHETIPEDGTTTLVEREFARDIRSARIFWRGEGEWVSAAPRRATPNEIDYVTQRALTLWFGDK